MVVAFGCYRSFNMKNLKGYKLEYKRGNKWNEQGFSWYLACRECNEMTKVGNQYIDSILCSTCVSKNLEDDNNKT